VSSISKLVRKFIEQPKNIDIGDVRRLLEAFGYKEKRKPGSESTFHKSRSSPINVPTVSGRAVKSPYVKRLVKILELEEWLEEHREE